MSKWKKVRLGDICFNLDSKRKPIKASERESGIYPYYGASGIVDYVSEFLFDENLLLVSEDGANLLARSSPIAFSVSGKLWVNNHAHVLRFHNLSTQKCVELFINHIDISKYVTGSAQPKLNQEKLNGLMIPIPPLEIQKQIAKTLDTAAELLTMRKQQLAELDNLIKSTFYDMFGDPITNEKGWEIFRLGDCLSVIGGYAFKSTDFSDEGIPVIKIGNINSGIFNNSGISFWKYDKKLDKYLLHPNDIIISLTGTVGKDDYANVCILPDRYPYYYLNQRNAKLELNEKLNVYYLLYVLKDTKIKRQLTGISRGIRQANISNADILALNIPLPTIKLQNQFASIVTKIEEQKALVKKAIDETQYLFESLMSEYFE